MHPSTPADVGPESASALLSPVHTLVPQLSQLRQLPAAAQNTPPQPSLVYTFACLSYSQTHRTLHSLYAARPNCLLSSTCTHADINPSARHTMAASTPDHSVNMPASNDSSSPSDDLRGTPPLQRRLPNTHTLTWLHSPWLRPADPSPAPRRRDPHPRPRRKDCPPGPQRRRQHHHTKG